MELIRTHLRRLTDFTGRENREPFWLWVLFLYVAQMVLSMVAAIPLQVWMQTTLLPQLEATQRTGVERPPEALVKLLPFFSNVLILATIANVATRLPARSAPVR